MQTSNPSAALGRAQEQCGVRLQLGSDGYTPAAGSASMAGHSPAHGWLGSSMKSSDVCTLWRSPSVQGRDWPARGLTAEQSGMAHRCDFGPLVSANS